MHVYLFEGGFADIVWNELDDLPTTAICHFYLQSLGQALTSLGMHPSSNGLLDWAVDACMSFSADVASGRDPSMIPLPEGTAFKDMPSGSRACADTEWTMTFNTDGPFVSMDTSQENASYYLPIAYKVLLAHASAARPLEIFGVLAMILPLMKAFYAAVPWTEPESVTRVPQMVMDSVKSPDASPEQQVASDQPHVSEVLAAEVSFWGDDEASVRFLSDPELPPPQSLGYLVRLVPYYYAKTMYSLGGTEPAEGLREYMQAAGTQVLIASVQEGGPNGADGVVNVAILGSDLRLVPQRAANPRLKYRVALMLTDDGTYSTTLDYEPQSGEAYYAPTSVVLILQSLLASNLHWSVVGRIGQALTHMSEVYAKGPQEWDTLLKLGGVPRDVVEPLLVGFEDSIE